MLTDLLLYVGGISTCQSLSAQCYELLLRIITRALFGELKKLLLLRQSG